MDLSFLIQLQMEIRINSSNSNKIRNKKLNLVKVRKCNRLHLSWQITKLFKLRKTLINKKLLHSVLLYNDNR